jgi:hypothetical protein
MLNILDCCFFYLFKHLETWNQPINPRPTRPQRCRQWCVESVLCLHTFRHLEALKALWEMWMWPGPPGDLPKYVRWDHDRKMTWKIDNGKSWKVGWIMMNRIFLGNSDHNRRIEDHWRILTAVFRIWNHQPLNTAEIAGTRHRTHFFPLRVLWADCAETAVGKTGSTHISVGGSKREHESFPLFSNNVFIRKYIGAGFNVKNGQLVETRNPDNNNDNPLFLTKIMVETYLFATFSYFFYL